MIHQPHIAYADVRTEARQAFRRGMQLIQDGQVDEGIQQLLDAYEILPHPNVLYNVARALAEAGRYEDAREYFERYLETDPSDREEVEQFVRALDTRMAQQRRADAALTGSQETEVATPETTTGAPLATADEIQALEDSATQIAALAEATQSESLRRRAQQLTALAVELRGRMSSARSGGGETGGGETGGGETGGGETGGGGAGAPVVPELEIAAREEETYDETVVSAARFAQSPLEAPASTAIITRQEIRLSGQQWIPELFRRVAGMEVMTLTPIDVSLSVRGFNQRRSNRMVVLIDGRSSYIDTLGTTLWSAIPIAAQDIERIEIIRGPASALYGANSFAGIVNIVTRPPGEPETSAFLGVGNAGTLFGHAATSGRVEGLGYRIAAGYTRTQRFSLEVAPERRDYRGIDLGDPSLSTDGFYANAGLRYRLVRGVVANLQLGIVDRLQNFQGTGPLRDFVARGPVGHVLASLETPYGSVRAFYTHLSARAQIGTIPNGGDALDNRFEQGVFDVEAEFAQEFDLLVHHNLHIGAGYRRKTITWDYLDAPHDQNHFAVFFQDAMDIVDWLSVVASFRVDFHPLLPDPVFSPRGAFIFHPTERSALRLSAGTAFRTPTFLESYLDLRNPSPIPGINVQAQGASTQGFALRPEQIISAEIGFRDEDSDYFDFEVNGYYNRVNDLVGLTQIQQFRLADFVAAGDTAYSAGTASYSLGTIGFENEQTVFHVVGGEAMTRIYPITGLDIYANYAINYTMLENAALLRTSEQRTSLHRVNVGITYRSDIGLDIGAELHVASEQRWIEPEFSIERGAEYVELELPAYYMVNARIGYRMFDDHLELGLVGFNITDHRFRQHPYGQELSARFLVTLAYRM